MKIHSKCISPYDKDVDKFIYSSDLEKCSIASALDSSEWESYSYKNITIIHK